MESGDKIRKFPKAECFIRMLISALLFVGMYLPLVQSLNASGEMVIGLALGGAELLVFTLLDHLKRNILAILSLMIAFVGVQFALPSQGLVGAGIEAVKAIILSFNKVDAATTMFAKQICLLLGAVLPILCFLFSDKVCGFFPATITTVLMLFAVCSMGKANFLWYAAPAFVAILLLISRSQHDRFHLPEVLPVAILVTVLSLLLLPVGKTVITPLYDSAMNLKQRITDYLFFNEEREIFSIGNYGWYPDKEKTGRMGGDAEPSTTPVMMVQTNGRILLRAISKDRYNGSDWENTFDMTRYQYRLRRYSSLRKTIFAENLPDAGLQRDYDFLAVKAVNVQIMNTASSSVFTPVTLRSADNRGSIVLYFNERGELFTTHNLEAGESYTVYAPVFEGGDEELNAMMASFPEYGRTRSDDFYTRYLQLPSHLEDTFYKDTEKITASYSSDYDKACAIMRNLKKYYSYTLTPGSSADNYDFVTWFLYAGKAGYSVHFASAMVIMCRMAGIPARYVEGFAAEPAEDGIAYITGENAKAWCEIWVEGFGWIPFDATNTSEETHNTPPETSPEPTPTPTPTPPPPDQKQDEPTPTPDVEPPEDDLQENDPPHENDHNPFPWWLLVLLLLIIALIIRILLTRPNRVAAKRTPGSGRVMVYGGAITRLAERKGIKLQKGEAPIAYAGRIDAAHIFSTPIMPVWQMLSAAAYGGAELTAAAEAASEACYQAAYGSQSLLDKLIFIGKTAFTAKPYDILVTHVVYEKPKSPYMQIIIPKTGKQKKSKPQKQNPPP